MLGKFLTCRERFRLRYIDGLKPSEGFNHRLEYGQLWHTCEEALAKGIEWEPELERYMQGLMRKHPTQQTDVAKWYMCCKMQFPIYVDYWKRHKDVEARTPLLQEGVFDIYYVLPSGRVVRLRGKWDAADIINKGVWLKENKTKGEIDEMGLTRQLRFDLQTMLYIVALKEAIKKGEVKTKLPVMGVRYNVIRRPLSGGKGTIKQKEGSKNVPAETPEEYWDRLQQYFIHEPETFFMRWNVTINQREVEAFEQRFLKPILEQLCDWYEHVTTGDPFRPYLEHDAGDSGYDKESAIHWQHPHGVVNYINESGSSEYDSYLETGNEVGLHRADSLFDELK